MKLKYTLVVTDNPTVKDTFATDVIAAQNHISNGGTLRFASLVERSDITVFLYEEDKLIGYSTMRAVLNSKREDSYYYVNQVALAKSHHGKGLGEMLYDHMFEFAALNKVGYIYAHVAKDNASSNKFHNKFYFEDDRGVLVSDVQKTLLARQQIKAEKQNAELNSGKER